ncbi:MAG: ribosome silencing factor [Spirochaetaceae bacterium]|nr:ribosome silencing factor [Spirochaetaceae bacterium]
MEDLNKKTLALAYMLFEHKAKDVVVIDLRELAFWTDFFIVGTVTSGAHLAGLQKRIKDWAREEGFASRSGVKTMPESGWSWTDLGEIVVHLMNEKERNFYELENLWSDAKQTRIE